MTDGLLTRAIDFHQKAQLAQAQSIYEEILKVTPDHFDALHLLGVIAAQTQQFQRAVDLMDKAVASFPHDAGCYFNRGLALKELGQLEAAIASYDRALALKPDYAEAWLNRGLAYHGLRQLSLSVESYDRAIALKPDYAEAWSNRGVVLVELKELEPAVGSYRRAITIRPDYAEAWFNLGVALGELGELETAVGSYGKAIAIRPDFAEAWFNRGNILGELKQMEPAAESFGRALALNPDGDYLLGTYLYSKMKICDWASLDELSNRLVTKIANHERAATPFQVLPIIGSSSILQQVSLNYVNKAHPLRSGLQETVKRPGRDKIRIGYFSADYHSHASMYWLAELFEKHDRSRFEIIAFSFGPDLQEDEMRKRVVPAFDRFIDVGKASDQEVAGLSREQEVDIAVDLKGFTKDSRTDIFAYRAAPVQVSYMGYPGTMGAGYIDYLIADHTLVPEQHQPFYTEKIVYLPDSYQGNDSKRRIAEKMFTRQELGLPATGFVFCCFNNNYKITPDIFDCWMRILERVEGSVLWLFEDNPRATGNLRKEAVRRGVDAGRLVFAERMPLPEHLARHRSADLFLDTLPCNAHTTASDALWAGLPLLTCIGRSFAGRVAASLLNAIRLPELVTSSMEEYGALAIELANNPEKLSGIKRTLEKNRLSTPLFDSDLFTGHFEAAYEQIYERYQLGLPPDHICVMPHIRYER
ncbi:MAG TPA: tetratricopeptide repeat protein [Chlorobaculum sp.]|nr:tetratricopeptide repeat protein [Chlorobaculum sp.]